MEETKKLKEKETVAYVVSADGAITDEFHEGDSYIKHTKESKEKKASFLKEESECVIFNEGVSFVKLYDDVLDELGEILSDADFKFCMRLAKHISFKDCVLRTNGNPNGKLLDTNDIAELLHMNPSSVRGRMSNLIKVGVLGRHVTGCKENPNLKFKCITCNPYIFTRGNKVNLTILSLFDKSKWN